MIIFNNTLIIIFLKDIREMLYDVYYLTSHAFAVMGEV